MDNLEKCKRFLELNNWKRVPDDESEYIIYTKMNNIGIYLNKEEIIFVDDSGDFCRIPCNHFALIGALIECRAIPFSYISFSARYEKIIEESDIKVIDLLNQ